VAIGERPSVSADRIRQAFHRIIFAQISAQVVEKSVEDRPDGRKSKTPPDDSILRDDQAALPPRKPPDPSVKQCWRRAKVRKLK
jgi:hypothetical protein